MENFDVCITYDPTSNWQLEVASSCDETLFYYDGEYIREATTHMCVTPSGTSNYNRVRNLNQCFIQLKPDESHKVMT